MKAYPFLISVFFALICLNQVQASELTINLSNQEIAGTLLLAIYSNSKDFEGSVKNESRSERGVFAGIESLLEPQEISVLKIEIPDGVYAIALFIDVNGNSKIDKNFIGIPKEQFGFSNNAMGKFSAPTFQQAAFNVSGETLQNIKLK